MAHLVAGQRLEALVDSVEDVTGEREEAVLHLVGRGVIQFRAPTTTGGASRY